MEYRRIFERINARFPLSFLNPRNGKEGEAETVDISANSVSFTTREKLSHLTPLEMWLHIPDKHEPLYVRGEVVWSGDKIGVRLEKAEFMGLARALWVKG